MSVIGALLWLSLNVYYEARSEDRAAQIAVAHVTINRSEESNKTIKEVVLKPHQFSWTGVKSRRKIPNDPEVFQDCVKSALIALSTPDNTGGATFFHEKSVKPRWVKKMSYLKSFGSHKFYKPKKSATKASKKNYNSRRV
ncbi:cell wall hydrolase [bacterium]|nr:cell wall hydrolase [bacterium]